MSKQSTKVNADFLEENFPHFIHQLQNTVQLMLLNWELFREEKNETHLEEIKQQIDYADQLFSKISTDPLTAQGVGKRLIKVEIQSLLTKIFTEFSERAPTQTLSFKKEGPSLLIGLDIFYFEEVLRLLLENAIKYTPENEKITLKLSQDEENILIILKNTGIGITKTLQEKIFKPFSRGNHQKSGMGIGLTIAQKIVQLHGGTLKVDSDERSFVSFLISLPKSNESTPC